MPVPWRQVEEIRDEALQQCPGGIALAVAGLKHSSQACGGTMPNVRIEYSPESEARLLKVYEIVATHYRQDVLLYWTRMSVFLVVQVALLAVVNGLSDKGDHAAAWIFAAVGAGTSLIWFLVARASLRWEDRWRRNTAEIDLLVNPLGSYQGDLLPRQTSLNRLLSRPAEIAAALPLLFLAGWLVLILI